MARKGWSDLSENYRRRLIKSGVTEREYTAGTANLAKARGHKSSAHERSQSAYYRRVDKHVRTYARTYGRDETEVREAFDGLTRQEIESVIAHQQRMEKLYDAGQTDRATAVYKMPPTPAVPDWIFYYHGAFH